MSSNPTGTSVEPAVLAQLIDTVHRRNGFVISDEIYDAIVVRPALANANG